MEKQNHSRARWSFWIISLVITILGQTGNTSSLGMAGTGVAAHQSVEASLLNPALLPFVKHYYFHTAYADSRLTENENSISQSITLIDGSLSAAIPARATYQKASQYFENSSKKIELSQMSVGFGYLYRPHLAFGVQTHMLETRDLTTQAKYTEQKVEAGTLLMLNSEFTLGAVIEKSLQGEKTPFGHQASGFEPNLRVGVQYLHSPQFHLRLELAKDTHDASTHLNQISAGLETLPFEYFPIRMGVRKINELDKTWYSAGIGWAGPRLVMNYGFETESTESPNTKHAVDMRLHF